MPSARFQQLEVGSNGCYPFLKRTAVQSALPFPSGSWRVLEQTPRSWVAVKSLLCALFLDCFLSVRPAASAPEEFSVYFSKTEKNAARVPLQPPTRQTSPSQMLICFRTRGPAWHSPHTPLLQRNLGDTPCPLTIPCLPPPPAALLQVRSSTQGMSSAFGIFACAARVPFFHPCMQIPICLVTQPFG